MFSLCYIFWPCYPITAFLRLAVLLIGRVLSGVCCSVTTANASLLVTQYSSLHRYVHGWSRTAQVICKSFIDLREVWSYQHRTDFLFHLFTETFFRRGTFLSLFSLMLGLGVRFNLQINLLSLQSKYEDMKRLHKSRTQVVNLTKDQNLKICQGFADIHSGRVASLEVVLSSASIPPCCTG